MRSALDIIRDLLELIGDDPDATLHLSVDTVADMRRVVAGPDGGRVMIPLLRTLNDTRHTRPRPQHRREEMTMQERFKIQIADGSNNTWGWSGWLVDKLTDQRHYLLVRTGKSDCAFDTEAGLRKAAKRLAFSIAKAA